MPSSYKVLGQVAPPATTEANLYTVPAGASAVCSTLVIANRGSAGTVRVAVRPAGAALSNQHYLAYEIPVTQADSTYLTIGITLAATDVVTVRASTADFSFSLFGTEVTA